MQQKVIVSGMFRSGTTHLWRLLAADPEFRQSYCEPLHASLPDEVKTWPHYNNYFDNQKALSLWQPEFSSQRLQLSTTDNWPELGAYLRALLQGNNLAKFVRLSLRLPWFKQQFSEAIIVNLIRDPRAVCYSMLHKPGESEIIRHDLEWQDWHAYEYFAAYRMMPEYRDYLEGLALSTPAVKILALWRINVEAAIAFTKNFSDSSLLVCHEDVVNHSQKSLELIYEKIGHLLPASVFDSVNSKIGDDRPWQQPTSQQGLYEYQLISDSTWEPLLEQAGLRPFMERWY